MPKSRRNRRTQRGMTLLELMGVILILGLLVGVGGVAVMNQVSTARVGTAVTQINQLANAIKNYQLDNNNRLPPDLNALIMQPDGAPNWKGPYLERNTIPQDPWGYEYQYLIAGDQWAVISLGADGQPGGEKSNADLADGDKDPARFLGM